MVNGCKVDNYLHRKYNIVMEQIKKLCTAANLLVDSESSFCFKNRTSKRMDLVVKLNYRVILIDVTTVG